MAIDFEWDILVSKDSFLKATLKRSGVLIPVWMAMTYGIVRLAQALPYVKSSELIGLLELWVVTLLALINQQWHTIMLALPDKLIHFSVTSEGLTVGTKRYSLTSLRPAITLLQQQKLPREEWDQPRPADGKPILLQIPTSQGTVTLKFAEESVKQSFIHTVLELLS